MSKWINLLWPSFAAAVIGEAFFFSFINPQELYLLGQPVRWSPVAVYSVGFFMFWGLTLLTTLIGHFFNKSADELNGPIGTRVGAPRQPKTA